MVILSQLDDAWETDCVVKDADIQSQEAFRLLALTSSKTWRRSWSKHPKRKQYLKRHPQKQLPCCGSQMIKIWIPKRSDLAQWTLGWSLGESNWSWSPGWVDPKLEFCLMHFEYPIILTYKNKFWSGICWYILGHHGDQQTGSFRNGWSVAVLLSWNARGSIVGCK